MIRTLEVQFGPAKGKRVREAISRLSSVRYPEGASSYYASELRHVLEAGAVLASVSLACTLLESVVRSLVVQHARTAVRTGLNLERALESKKSLHFAGLVDELVKAGLFDAADADRAKRLYRDVRIPIHHRLSRRFVTFHDDHWSIDFRELLRQGSPVTLHHLEEVVETHGLNYVDEIVGVIDRNSA